jgi:hypothetical protein
MIMENLLQKNPMLWTISLFLFMFAAFIYFKPSMTFGPKGSLRNFGVHKRGSTVFPLWWWTFIMAVIARITVKKLSA